MCLIARLLERPPAERCDALSALVQSMWLYLYLRPGA
jgi:hypothetical protein